MYDNRLRPGIEAVLEIALDRFDAEYAHYQEMWKQDSTDEAMLMRQEAKLLAYNDVIVAITRPLLVLE